MNKLFDQEERKIYWTALKVPKPGQWSGLQARHSIDPPVRRNSDSEDDSMDDARAPGYKKPMVNVAVDPKAIKMAKKTAKIIDPMGLSFNRIVGHGAHGVASLFDLKPQHQNQSTPKRVILKTSLDPEDPFNGRERIEHEKRYHRVRTVFEKEKFA